jgi:hypothetical protein
LFFSTKSSNFDLVLTILTTLIHSPQWLFTPCPSQPFIYEALVIMFFICKIYIVIFSDMVWIMISRSCNHNSLSLSKPSTLCLYSINAFWCQWFASFLASFHASSFFFISFHSFSNVVHSIILFFNFLFFMVIYNIFTLIFSFVSFCLFQIIMRCLYYSYIFCLCFIYYNNPCFSPSTMVNIYF